MGTQSGCGGDSNAPPSGLDTRVFIAIQSSSISSLVIANATKDQLTSNLVQGVGAAPSLMIPGANNTTLVFASGTVSIVDNQKETLAAAVTTNCPSGASSCPPTLPPPTATMPASPARKFPYAPIPT